jgi:hypothetical protein
VRVFLHIGPHKTGTTSIQQVLLNSRTQLHYPEPPIDGPGHAAYAVEVLGLANLPEAEVLGGNLVRGAFTPHPDAVSIPDMPRNAGTLLGDMVDAAREDTRPFVWSCEWFSIAASLSKTRAGLIDLARRHPVEPIFTLRPPRARLWSSLQESVKQHWPVDLDDPASLLDTIQRQPGYYAHFVRDFMGFAPWSRAHFVICNEDNPDFLAQSFSRILGCALTLENSPRFMNRRSPYAKIRLAAALHRERPELDWTTHLAEVEEKWSLQSRADPALGRRPYPPLPPALLAWAYDAWRVQMKDIAALERAGRAEVYRPSRWSILKSRLGRLRARRRP